MGLKLVHGAPIRTNEDIDMVVNSCHAGNSEDMHHAF